MNKLLNIDIAGGQIDSFEAKQATSRLSEQDIEILIASICK